MVPQDSVKESTQEDHQPEEDLTNTENKEKLEAEVVVKADVTVQEVSPPRALPKKNSSST